MARRIPMTPHGRQMLVNRLKRLKQVDRPHIVTVIEEARGHGDIQENAEYDAAKERQFQISKQIEEIEHKLSLAHVIDPKKIESDKVVFGATVTLADTDNTEQVTYKIVGSDEADIALGKISIDSPLARALIGKEAGDEVRVQTPKGLRRFEIVAARYE
jgi:transcription elongation factor GreA